MDYVAAVYLPLLISSGALLICIASFIFLRSYLKHRTRPEFLKDGVLSEIREEVNGLTGDINETTERDITLIKEREKELRSLLEEIDRKLKTYVREINTLKESEEVYASLPQAGNQTQNGEKENSKNIDAYLALGKNRHKANVPGDSNEDAKDSKETAKESSGAKKTANDQIRELLQAGFSASVIAARLGISIAEAEFAVSIFEPKDPVSDA